MSKGLLIVTALAVSAVAHAQSDPLEAAAVQQVAAQAPGATLAAPFFKGADKKTDWNIVLESGKCYWFSGVSGGNVKKLALYLWGPTGFFRLTDAKSTTGQVTMAYCAKESGMHKFQAKIEGAGFYTVGVFVKDAPPQAVPPPAPVQQAQPAIDLAPLCDKQASVVAAGARRVGEFFDGVGGSIGHKDRADYSLQLDGGKCYWVIACGEPDHIKALSLYLWGPNGKRITEAKPDSPNAMVGHCAQQTGMFKVQSVVAGGSGRYKVGVYAK